MVLFIKKVIVSWQSIHTFSLPFFFFFFLFLFFDSFRFVSFRFEKKERGGEKGGCFFLGFKLGDIYIYTYVSIDNIYLEKGE